MISLRQDRSLCAAPERLGAWQDGELSASERAELAAHLERCASCAAALEHLIAGDRRLAAARPTPPPLTPAASRALLERALAEAGGRRRWAGGWLPWTWGLAAGLALVAAGVGLTGWGALQRGPAPGGTTVALAPQRVEAAGPNPHPEPSPKSWGRGDGPPPPGPLPQKLGEGGLRWKASSYVPPLPAFGGGLGVRVWARSRPAPRTPAHWPRRRSHHFLTARLARPGAPLRARLKTSADQAAPGTGERVAERFPELNSRCAHTNPAAAGGADAPAVGTDAAVQTGTQEVAALPRTGGAPGEAAAVPQPPAPAPPRLLVLVASEPAPSPVRVTVAPESAPSYARAIALRPDASGSPVWTQATACDDGTGQKLALVMLGSQSWPRGKGQ